MLAFREGTPYQGEDLIYDATAPGFLVRCTRNGTGTTPGSCLYERRIDTADVVCVSRAMARRLARGRRQDRPTDREAAAAGGE